MGNLCSGYMRLQHLVPGCTQSMSGRQRTVYRSMQHLRHCQHEEKKCVRRHDGSCLEHTVRLTNLRLRTQHVAT